MAGAALEYARRLYDDVLGWYQNADAKAQVILAIDGAFLAFLTSAMFTKPEDIKSIVRCFTGTTWGLLSLMVIFLLASVASALFCLWSRVYSPKSLAQFIQGAQRVRSDPTTYSPRVLWFFQVVAELDDEKFLAALRSVDEAYETEALSSQIKILSENVRSKHTAVNIGFVLTAATLVVFFLAGVTYLNTCAA